MVATLKRVSVDAPAAPPSKSAIPTIEIGGKLVSEYNEAIADYKAAEAVVAEVKPKVLQEGLSAIFRHNVSMPAKPATSVELMDATGSKVRLTHQGKYSVIDPDNFVRILEQVALARGPKIELDPNAFVQEVVLPKFDTKVLFDTDGNFREEVFNAYHKAIVTCTAELVKKGVLAAGTGSPLMSERKFQPRENFHTARWLAFPSIVEQRSIQAAAPNTVTLTPLK